jgi:hypothetical protein
MRKFIALFFVLTCCLAVSSAQQKKPASPDKWEVFGGYSYSRANVGGFPFSPMSLNGGQASGSYFFLKNLGLTGEFAAYTDTVESELIHSQGYFFGPTGRIALGHGKYQRVSLSAHQLFGTTHFSFKPTATSDCPPSDASCSPTTNSFTMISGGGVDIKLSKHFSIRPAQMEYFTQQLKLTDLESEPEAKPRANAISLAEESVGSPKLSTNGFRYSAGAVYHF